MSDMTMMANAKQQAGAAANQVKQDWNTWQTAHPNWKSNVQKSAHDWNVAHPNAQAEFQAGMQQFRTGVQDWNTAHPEFKSNVQAGWQHAQQDMQAWSTAHPDATIDDLIDAIVAYMTPERRAKAKNLIQSVVDMLMEVEQKVETKVHDMRAHHTAGPGGVATTLPAQVGPTTGK